MEAAAWSIVGTVLVVLALVAGLIWWVRRGRDAGSDRQQAAPRDERPLVTIVVNPTKFDDLDPVQHQIDALAHAHGWRTSWRETTVEDPGTGQTRGAVEAGSQIVCALGGDGTVRSVAAGLLHSSVPMGLLPAGTGNLLARNLDLDIDSLESCFLVAINGDDRRIDVGRLVVAPEETQDDARDYYFLVMAGLGFDAAVMAQAPEKLKATVGWGAYVVSGLTQLDGPRFEVGLVTDGELATRRKVRSIVLGNVGRLQGGVELLPDAEVDDGCLDVVLLAPEGVAGWAAVALRILTKRRKGHKRVEHFQCQSLGIDLAGYHHEELQLDGDPIGPARSLTASIVPKALTVRVPTGSRPAAVRADVGA
ncbi:MAG: diacylglycerol kinase family protein [Mobilicoccus sp.]|nr:diacylglycerol kinase family protein [Mobilicoccus sp.]